MLATDVRVVLATGRSPWDGVSALAADLGLSGPHIAVQGAVICDPDRGVVHRARAIPPSVFNDAIRLGEEAGIDPLVGLIDGYHAACRPAEVDFAEVGHSGALFQPEDDLRRLVDQDPLRVFLPTVPELHRRVRAAAARRLGGRASIVWSDTTGIDVLAAGTSKGEAVDWLASHLGIGAAEIAAVGDARNDIEMLRIAARSAAMGSAPWDVRAAADVVVPTSEEEGLIDALGWLFPDLAGAFREPRVARTADGRRGSGRDEPLRTRRGRHHRHDVRRGRR